MMKSKPISVLRDLCEILCFRTLFYYIATEADVLDILTDFAITFILQVIVILNNQHSLKA